MQPGCGVAAVELFVHGESFTVLLPGCGVSAVELFVYGELYTYAASQVPHLAGTAIHRCVSMLL